MKAMNDHELIREFAATRSEQAFRRLVDRHCDLVFSVASRVTRDPDLARDVSQQAFCKLAAKPNSVPSGVPLAAWLHRTCRSLAVDLVRSEEARRKREVAHSHPSAMNSETTPDWSRLEPVIDSLIDELPELDRRAVLLRFYEKRSHGAIGAALGLSEEAARKRLDRALERLRHLLSKRGIATTSAALATILPAHASTPAPAGLAASLSSTALSTATVTTASTTTILAIIMSKKAVIAGASLLLLAGVASIAVPRLSSDKASHPTVASSPQEEFKPSESALPALSAGKQRASDSRNRLSGKYGDARTKLSAHIQVELMALLEDLVSVMELAHKLDLGDQLGEDPAEPLGEVGKHLNLTDEQKKLLGRLQMEAFQRESNNARAVIAMIKEKPEILMEYLLAEDAMKRGDMTAAEYERIQKNLGIPEEEISKALGGEGDPMKDDALDDEVFVEDFLAILDEEQARVFQEGLAARNAREQGEAEETFHTLEEMEKQISSGRKMIGGAKQLMEGLTEDGP
jgi:RNA polymerase sigma factor (sigma-70 family)